MFVIVIIMVFVSSSNDQFAFCDIASTSFSAYFPSFIVEYASSSIGSVSIASYPVGGVISVIDI